MKRLFFFFLLSGVGQVGCGQKGPPLAPIVYLPRPVAQVTAKRLENDIVLQFQIPELNTDGTGPADLRRIEVYAHTGPLSLPADFLKYGTLIASIDVKQPPPPVPPGEQKAESKESEESGKESGKESEESGKESGKESEESKESEKSAPDVAGATTPPETLRVADPQAGMIQQGQTTSVRETLTPKHMEIGPMPPVRPAPPPDPDAPVVVVEKIETPGTVNFDLPTQRYYVLFGVSESRNRRGPAAGPLPVALLEPLSPPEKVEADYTEHAISLNWPGQREDVAMTRPVGLSKEALGLGPDDAAPEAPTPNASASAPNAQIAAADKPIEPLPPVDRETEGTIEFFSDVETDDTRDVFVAITAPVKPSGVKQKPPVTLVPQPPAKPRFGYNVYEADKAGPIASASAPPAQTATADRPAPNAPNAPIAPLNAALLTAPGFSDPRVEFGTERCYVVRRVEMVGPVAIESAPSSPTCVKPVDTFPPTPPKSLAHIASGNGVSLLWEANTEPDLAGYVVLRGEAPGDKLSPLTKEPIADTSFLDTTARRGRTYVYEVVAVDKSTPPNQSAPSNRVEETIR